MRGAVVVALAVALGGCATGLQLTTTVTEAGKTTTTGARQTGLWFTTGKPEALPMPKPADAL